MVRIKGKRFVIASLALGLSLLGARSVRADGDMVDNPEYASWAKCKPGTSVTYSRQMTIGGASHTVDTTSTLTEVTPDHVVVELKMTMANNGSAQDLPAQKRTIDAKVAKGSRPDEPHAGDPAPETGTEDVQAVGKTFSCKWIKLTHSQGAKTTTVKFWRSDDVPGGLVKMDGDLGGSGKISMLLTAIDVK